MEAENKQMDYFWNISFENHDITKNSSGCFRSTISLIFHITAIFIN